MKTAADPILTLDRREFIKTLGGGILVFFTVVDPLYPFSGQSSEREYPEDFNAYLKIGEDSRIACYSGKIEMGQGIITSLGQMLAEELDVALDTVDVILGDTALCPYDRGTFGSRTTKYFGPALREAAAEARAILLQLGMEHLKLPAERLALKAGVISDKKYPNKKVTYGDLARGRAIKKYIKPKPKAKPISAHTISGKSADRSDGRLKVTGEAVFAADIRLPGMLYARILRPPAHGALLKKVSTSAAREIKGIHIVEEKDMIAACHEQPEEADRALKLIQAEYSSSKNRIDNTTIFQHLLDSAPSGRVEAQSGDPKSGKAQTKQRYIGTYYNHYVAHAPMENHTALVSIKKGSASVWVSSQTPFRARDEVAQTLGFSPDKVRVRPAFVGGGFGGKTRNQQVVEAARLAQATGKPVLVEWSRKEEFFYDTYRPAAVIKIYSGTDDSGRILDWNYHNYYAGSRSSTPFYAIPNYQILSYGSWRGRESPHPFMVGAWRGPGSNTNVFAMESQTDLMAAGTKMDPLSFRMQNLQDKRMRRVLQAAADQFGHTLQPAPSSKGYGLACTDYLGTYVAAAAEVEADIKSGRIKVKRVVCAQDTGEIINPEGIKLQIEGCINMGLGYVLSEKIRFSRGKVMDENFDTYEIPRFSWIPKIETVLIDNPEIPPQGCGEPAITCMGAVIANAVYDALGVRLYELPMTPNLVKAALQG